AFIYPGGSYVATERNMLFQIDRSRDPDVIMYDVNLNSLGELDKSNPINIYWIKNTQKGIIKPLTGIQKKFGYGLKFISISENMADFQFVSYFDRVFKLRKTDNNQFKVFTVSHNKKVEVQRLYVQFEDKSSWIPNILNIELYGIDTDNGNPVHESIAP
ncbi:MAG: DUF4833 domain-containing protein, partial [Bacteroidales bacterium]|nr:DUF4833 domain-containing protein [Bacteroidales bacterium]